MASAEEFVSLFVPINIVFIVVIMFAFGLSPEGALNFMWNGPLGYFLLAMIFFLPDLLLTQFLPAIKILFLMSAILWIATANGVF